MKAYIFGNRDLPEDNSAFKVAEKLGKYLDDVQFVEVKPNEDLPFANGEDVVIMDVVEGLHKVIMIDYSSGALRHPELFGAKSRRSDEVGIPTRASGDLDSSDRIIPQNDEVKEGRVILPPRNSVHDFDLGFQLKYLQKLGKLGKVTIIGIPQNGEVNYASIHSIFKKLVAQDIQGS